MFTATELELIWLKLHTASIRMEKRGKEVSDLGLNADAFDTAEIDALTHKVATALAAALEAAPSDVRSISNTPASCLRINPFTGAVRRIDS